MSEGREHRQHRRIAVDLQVEEQHGDVRYFQRAGNLSQGGMFLEGTIPHPPGTRVTLRVSLPGGAAPIELHGEIVASADPARLGMHVRFVDLDEATMARLAAFIEQRA